jgi:hypothetical protein
MVFGKFGMRRDESRSMLEKLASEHLRLLADKVAAVRAVRDRMLSPVRNAALVEEKPARGEHNPSANLGLDVVPESNPARMALEDALSALRPAARRELWAVVLVGRGDHSLKDWERALAEANRLTDVGTDLFMGVADLHENLMKVVDELERI